MQSAIWRASQRQNAMRAAPVLLPERCSLKKPMTEKFDDEDSGGNVHANLRRPNAERLKIKSGLVIEITKAIRSPGITQVDAGEHMGLAQPKVSLMLRGQFSSVSARRNRCSLAHISTRHKKTDTVHHHELFWHIHPKGNALSGGYRPCHLCDSGIWSGRDLVQPVNEARSAERDFNKCHAVDCLRRCAANRIY